MTPEKCLGIKVYPSEAFYAIPFRRWKEIFDPSKAPQVLLESLRDSFVLHTWGRFSSEEPIMVSNKEHVQHATRKYGVE